MNGRLLCLIIIGWGLFFPCAAPVVQGAEFTRKSPADNHPIEISADRLEANDAKKVVLFSGNAVATQGDRVIKAEKIFLYYKKEERDPGREGLRDIGKTGDLEKMEAKGHVSVSQGDRLVTGDQAVYYQESQKIVMTGSAVMQQGNNIVRGDKIEVFLNENRGVVEASENRRVKATIYPVEKK
jgi:lipopolysaccharide export system protein LptA